ncbi:multidrug effflux MFS transporter [Speluncibacter jeojiensis]|uniref:Multidrug effflux MFS transporter n=1 Tax=Speluncibacter jeojiensis TaxID=2710754 RepID=A0A9X4M6P6_9ACTN|nr:multidrug effflux MFS transporter [Corynebacteriales bacterium D3-21]
MTTTTATQVMSLRRSILVLGTLEVFGPLSMDLYMPSLPDLARDLGTSDALSQATMSASMIGLGLGQLIAGPLSDRLGRRPPLLVGVALFSVLSLLCAAAPDIEVLLAVRFLQGLAGSAGIVMALTVARDLFDGVELSRLLSMLALVAALAPILAPVIGGQLAAVMSWRGIFVVLAGFGAAIFLIGATLLRETLPPERRHGGGVATTVGQFGTVLRDRAFVAILAALVFGGITFFTYLASISFVVQGEHHLSPQAFSVIFAANSVASVLGAQLNRALVRRAGPLRMYVVAAGATAAAALALLAFAVGGSGLAPVLVTLAVLLACSGMSSPNSSVLALDSHAAHAGTAAALLGMATFVAGPLVAPLVSVGGATTMTMSVTMAVSSVIAAAIAWGVVVPAVRRRDAVRAAETVAVVTEPAAYT